MTKRFIRLKELTPDTDVEHAPIPEFFERSDDTLTAGPFRARTDGQGFLITGNDMPAVGDPVVFLGDSFVESMFADETLRFVSVIERQLTLPCLNAGYSGSTTLQLLNSLTNKVFPAVGPGTTVVLFPPHSDRDNIYLPGSYWNNTAKGAALLPVGGGTPRGDMPSGVAAAVTVLNIFVATANLLGLRLVLATTPFRAGDFSTDKSLRHIYKRNREVYQIGVTRRREFCDAVRGVAAATVTPLIDAEAMLGGDPQYFYDELHLNHHGHEHLARAISPVIGALVKSTGARG